MSEIINSKIRHTHDLLKSKQISCEELTKKYLEEANNLKKELNAYVTLCDDLAIESAKAVDKKIEQGEEISLLEGIPMTLKDNISTNGIETTCCSKILKGYVPIYDATVWDILKRKNAILLGKTNMDEFAMGSTSETSCIGGSLNPHNIKHVAGGSSGGVASAVAGNIAVYGLGSDTGGSVREPASFCGIVGLKPTYGSVSRYGLIAYGSSFDQIGTLTTTAEDAAIVFDAISGYDEKDSTSSNVKREPTLSKINDSLEGLRIGIAEEYFMGINDEIKESLEKAIKVYESLGAKIVRFKLPELKYALPVYYILACAEASSNLGRFDGIRYGYRADNYSDIDEMICKTRSKGFGKEVQRRILLGTYVLSSGYYDAYYKKAQKLRRKIIYAFREAFKNCDIILSPTAPSTSYELNYSVDDPVEMYMTDICTVPINTAGVPAISIPCGFDKSGLPIGMQLIGNMFSEGLLLNAANIYEKEAHSFKSVDMGVRI